MALNYSIGLDIGVASVGWACMTPDFRIPKFNGRYAMGVREFEAAETAETRRLQRGTRRRYNRRIKRIQLLQQTLSPLFKDDLSFFMRNDENDKHFWRNSNQFENNSLSETLRYLGMNTRKYPTIYHLRHALLMSDKKFHPRFIYLALHHLVKYRGHFLNENMSWDSEKDAISLERLLSNYFIELKEHGYEQKELAQEERTHIIEVMEAGDITASDKQKQIVKMVGRDMTEPIKLILGLTANIAKLFPQSTHGDMYKENKLKIAFTEEDITEVFEKLTDDEKTIIEQANTIYQTVLLKDLIGDAHSVAEAKVNAYEQFGDDLKLLKRIYNDFLGEEAYRKMFITTRENKEKYDETRKPAFLCEFDNFLKVKSNYEEKFYKDVKKQLEQLLKGEKSIDKKDQALLSSIIDRIDREQFLQKQKGRMNGAIPHQNNVYEATTVLKNQQKHYPEITDEMIEKVKQIISFRIPYYIGPLVKDNENAEFGWAVRKQKNHVTPWTVEHVIDRSKSAEKFIERMTNYCAYLTNEKVLPKHSLLYQKFEVLNELNGIQIRATHETPHKKYRLNKEEKAWILANIFFKYKTVTHKILKRELKKSPFKHIILDENTGNLKEIYGTQKEDRFSTSLSTYIDMEKIFGDISNVNNEMLEKIIYWITVFEEKDIIAVKIKEKYPQINKKQVNQLIYKTYTGWGRLSKRLLNELPADKVENLTILDMMENEPLVFMEALAIEKYDLKERITKMNQKNEEAFTKIKYKDIEELQGSPAIKKGIWQAILIIEELVDVFGEPENIMIEFAREEGKKKPPKSRKRHLSDLQKAISRDEKELKQFLKEHIQYEEGQYRDKRLYLYITQQGKCMYSGESLNISRLQDYEVDHILPRSFVKDDSMDNLALVKKSMNQAKGDNNMPLEILNAKDQVKQRVFWKKLYENGLISRLKYSRLNKEAFSAQDKESFFARQLVETRQITRHVKELLNERFEHAEIHPVNANIVTSLRKHTNTIKIRSLNNKHHAIDAALAVLVVQFIINRYGVNFLNFNFKYQEAHNKWKKMISTAGKHFFLFADIDKYDKFFHFQTGELLKGREFLSMLNDEMPWQTTKKVGSGEAAFYKQTLFSPKEPKGKNPQYQSSKLSKGVHSNLKRECTYLISYIEEDKRGKKVVKNEFVDFYVIEKYQFQNKSTKDLALFLANKVAKGEVLDAKIHTKILKYQLIEYKNHPFYHVSTKEKHNGKQLILDKELLKRLYRVIIMKKKKEIINVDELKNIFFEIALKIKQDYKEYIPKGKLKQIENYIGKIIDFQSFSNGLEELFITTSTNASRSKVFEVRYRKKLDPSDVYFIHQSITGLRYRKPKSYKNELWSK